MSASGAAAGSLNFCYDSVPEPAESWLVCPDIRWVRLPLPFALNHVNCWLLGEPGEQVLIDTGVANNSTIELWQRTLADANAADSMQWPKQLLVTHFHPDHMGLAGWFHNAGVSVVGSEIEVGVSRQLWSIDDRDYGEFYASWYASNGLPDDTVEAVRNSGNRYRSIVHEPPAESDWQFLKNGQKIVLGGYEYQVIIGRGHAPDMLMLYRDCDHVLIAADQVLPSITPNVSIMPRLQDTNPLGSFLQTLMVLKDLPEDTLVLPSHGIPFRGIEARINALAEHHELRLAEVLNACERPQSPYELFSVLFRRELDAQQTSFALGESLAHLRYLEHQGALESDILDGVTRFLRA
jgi:glyoxylase-like metal-dependent hydrolase (beta-lactamase superfamily II)